MSNSRCTSGNCMRIGDPEAEDQPLKSLVREVDLSGATAAVEGIDALRTEGLTARPLQSLSAHVAIGGSSH